MFYSFVSLLKEMEDNTMPVYKDKERNTYYFVTRINGKQVKRRGFKTKKEGVFLYANDDCSSYDTSKNN